MMFSGYVSEQCINNDEWFVTNDNGYVKEQYLYFNGTSTGYVNYWWSKYISSTC